MAEGPVAALDLAGSFGRSLECGSDSDRPGGADAGVVAVLLTSWPLASAEPEVPWKSLLEIPVPYRLDLEDDEVPKPRLPSPPLDLADLLLKMVVMPETGDRGNVVLAARPIKLLSSSSSSSEGVACIWPGS